MLLTVSVFLLASRGIIQYPDPMRLVPTGVLIGQTVEDPGSVWPGHLRTKMGWELSRRVRAGSLNPSQQERLARSSIDRASTVGGLPHVGADQFLGDLAGLPNATTHTKQLIAEFLLQVAPDPDQHWNVSMSVAVRQLRMDGTITDAQWESLVEAAHTPRITSLADGALKPGQQFALGVTFLSGRLGMASTDGMSRTSITIPPGLEQLWEEPGKSWPERLGTGLPGDGFRSEYALFRAPEQPGEYEIVARTWVSHDVSDPARWGELSDPAPAHVRVFESRLTIEVREPNSAATAPDPVAVWLKARLLPVTWSGGASGVMGRYTFPVKAIIAGAGSSFLAKGRLVAVDDLGVRRRIYAFGVSVENNRAASTWNDLPFGSPTGSVAAIQFDLNAEYAHPASGIRWIGLFDRVELPNGLVHEGPDPIEIELQLYAASFE